MTSKIWFMPSGADRMAEIDFGRACRIGAGPTPVYRQTVQESLSGVQSTVIYSGRSTLTLRHDWNRGTRDASGDGDLLRRKLFTLIAHLQRGGSCVFALDALFCHAGFALDNPASNTGSINIDVDLMRNLGGSFLASGRELMVQSDHDDYLIEQKVCTTHLGRKFTLTQPLATDMSDCRWVLVREYYTYPALRLPAELRTSGDFLVHDQEMTFHLNLPLEEDPAQMDAYQVFGMPLPGTAQGPGHFELDPDVLVPATGGALPYEWKG